MKHDRALHSEADVIRPDILHPIDCRCPACPSTPRLTPIERALLLIVTGFATAAALVAVAGQLKAALRALVGL